MRATSGIVSLATHVMLVAAALWATTEAHPVAPPVEGPVIVLPWPKDPVGETGGGIPTPLIEGEVRLPPIEFPSFDAGVPRTIPGVSADTGPVLAGRPAGDGSPIESSLADEPPVMLAGPAAAYPDLLRQAGIQGRVVLEAVIDTLGHVEPGSVVVAERAHPAFVASAQRSLVASLFRPARVMGHAVRVRVRLPFDFVLQHGRL